jgi:hypothetical protein
MFSVVYSIWGLMAIKSIRPFMKKEIIPILSIDQFLIINTISVLFILLIFFNIKKYKDHQENPLKNILTVYNNLDLQNKLFIFIFAIMSIIVIYLETFIELSPVPTNSILMKIIGSISTVLLVFYLNDAPINRDIVAGYIITFFGLYLIGNKIVRT